MRVLILLLCVVAVASSAAAAEVHLVSGAYAPGSFEAKAGETVVITNDDGMPHTVTSAWDDGASFSRVLKPHESVALVFQQPGDYVIRCVPHSAQSDDGSWTGMVAHVHVAGVTATASHRAPWEYLLFVAPLIAGGAWLAWRATRSRPQW